MSQRQLSRMKADARVRRTVIKRVAKNRKTVFGGMHPDLMGPSR